MYALIGQTEQVEFEMFTFPIFMIISDACPKGVEAMSMALMGMLINTNFSMKGQMGLVVNGMFSDCKNEFLETCYGDLAFYALIGTCIPFIFISLLIPNRSQLKEIKEILSLS